MIEIRQCTYRYPDGSLGFMDCNAKISSKESWGIVGSNGSGKSTLIQCLAGIHKPQSGQIFYEGKPLEWKGIAHRSQLISTILQNPQDQLFQPTIEKEILFTLKQAKIQNPQIKLEEVLELCHLSQVRHLHPYDVSYSKQKLILLACACARPQNIILMDEITSGLDEVSKQVCGNVVEFLKNEGKTIIMVSHDMNFVAEHCDHLMILHEHQCTYRGTLKEAMQYESLFKEAHLELPDVVKLSLALNLPLCTTRQEWIELWTKK
jgi:energy-coupling factor transporter ATP-binding protein EcfA2